MSMTMSQKILAKKSGKAEVAVGEHIVVDLDLVFAHDPVMAVLTQQFHKHFGPDARVWDPQKIALFQDHLVPAKDVESTKMIQIMDEFVKKQQIANYFPYGKNYGVCHIIILEQGLARPGEIVVGTDSHTVTYGSFNCFATGMGVFDVAIGLGTGKAWVTVPDTILVHLNGKLRHGVGAKDIILKLIGTLKMDGARGCSIEFRGDLLENMSLDERATLCNMVVEAGATNGIMKLSQKARDFLRDKKIEAISEVSSDPDCRYRSEVEIDCSAISPMLALPHRPDNVVEVGSVGKKIPIHQVYVGSCTGGKLYDIVEFCETLGENEIAEGVTVVVVPATTTIYKEMLSLGLIEKLMNKGAVVESPGCKACYGVHGGVTRDHENCLATINRNFLGRMGNPKSNIFLSSPYIAAKTAIAGFITQ